MATARNDITGAALRTKAATENVRSGWDRIFGKKDEPEKKKEQPEGDKNEHDPAQRPTE